MALDTPVAFFIFNRPDLTQRVFEAISLARPRRLLVVADGPRVDRKSEVQGWAAWRRAWRHYDFGMRCWPAHKASGALDYFGPLKERVAQSYERVYRGGVDTWDAAWALACEHQGGLSIVPRVNMLRNLGFRR